MDPRSRSTYHDAYRTGPPPANRQPAHRRRARRRPLSGGDGLVDRAAPLGHRRGAARPPHRDRVGAADLEETLDPVAAARRAVLLAPDQAECHVRLADAFDDLGNRREALRWYRTARRLDPDWAVPQLGAAAVHLRLGEPGTALEILEQLYRRTGGAEPVGDHWAAALAAVAEQVPVVREDDVYFITRRAEIREMLPPLARALAVATDPVLVDGLTRVRRYVRRCRRRELTVRWLRHPRNPWPARALAGLCGGALVTAAYLSTGTPSLLVVAAALVGLGAYAAARSVLIPRWRLNGWAYERQTDGRAVAQPASVPDGSVA